MKEGIHPTYQKCEVVCASCGTKFETRSTVPEIHVEICSVCHPFYTGKQKLIDSAGRVDRFRDRMRRSSQLQKPAGKVEAKDEAVEKTFEDQTVEIAPEGASAEAESQPS
jgi:large subunit ribosomal protein L31